MQRVLLVFLDGVGLGDDDASYNPFLAAQLPVLYQLLDGKPLIQSSAPHHATMASLVALDATLGVEGTPQSGTGQATLFTGQNAAQLYGRHFGPWVPAQLRGLVGDESVLARAQRAGHSVAFANAYPEEVLQHYEAAKLPADSPTARRSRHGAAFLSAGPPLAALGAGLLTRHTAALEAGDAIASEITNDGWRVGLGRTSVPVIDAATAGRNLVRIASQHQLTLFAHYATDYAGHRQDLAGAVHSLQRCDAFLGGIVDTLPDDLLVIIASDHGNIEDVRVGHTRNPALGLVIGAGHEAVAIRLHSLIDVTPAILDVLDG